MNVISSRPLVPVTPGIGGIVGGRSKGGSINIKEEVSSDIDDYNDVNFYNDIPIESELSLDEFEIYALARLKVLRKIEELKVRNIIGDEYRKQLSITLKEQFSSTGNSSGGGNNNNNNNNIDLISHYILRAAYCRTEELRRWFLTQEVNLFKYRLELLMNNSTSSTQDDTTRVTNRKIKQLLKRSKITNLTKINDNTKNNLRSKLLSIPGHSQNPVDYHNATYYKIPFIDALDLISSRSCYVENGYVYVPLNKIVTIITSKFRCQLSKSLVLASSAFNLITQEEERIAPLLKNMNQQYIGKSSYGTDNDMINDDLAQLSSNNIDMYAKQSMPLCMQQLHLGLKHDHKLKHWGRLQYGLFLKGAGLSMDESIAFFQREFTKIMTSEQFHKNYSYNIRHMYGKEGKRASYTPYNCTKIIIGNQAPSSSDDHHGCPYKHYDDEHLSALLGKLKIGNSTDRNNIMTLKKQKQYNLACAKHFDIMHPNITKLANTSEGSNIQLDGIGNHPNAWFSASASYHAVINKNKGTTTSSINNVDTNNITPKKE